MSGRPRIVTIICVLLVVFALLGLIPAYMKIREIEATASFPLRSSTYATLPILALGTAAAQVIMALGMLQGQNWARLLFIFLTPITLLGFLIQPGATHAVRLVYYLIFLALLTRPSMVPFFRGRQG